MKKFLFSFYVIFEFICSSIGFVVIVMFAIAMLQKDACVSIDSRIFGKFEKDACAKVNQQPANVKSSSNY